MKRLTITADDCGIHPDIDSAIIACIKAGNVDNVDCMVTLNYPGYNSLDAIDRLKRECHAEISTQKLSIGLHASLTCGIPLTGATYRDLFCDAGIWFNPIERFNFRDFETTNRMAIRDELNAQYQLYMDIIPPNQQPHVSCHAGIFHLTDLLTATYLEFCSEHQAHTRNPFLLSTLKQGNYPLAPDNSLKVGNGITTGTNMVVAGFHRMKRNIHFNNLGEVRTVLGYRIGHKLQSRFNYFVSNNLLRTSNFFIDHFYMSGAASVIYHVFTNMKEYSYEMVVHPIRNPQLKLMHSGVDTEAFPGRFNEFMLLSRYNFIDDFIRNYNPTESEQAWNIQRYVI